VCETVESKDTTNLLFEKNTKYLARMISFTDSRTDPLPKHGTNGTTAFLDAPNKYRQGTNNADSFSTMSLKAE
jgi:hypothetical protein